MDEQRYTTARQHRQGSPQVGFIDRRKLVDTRRHQKALEAADAGVDQRVKLAVIAGHDAAPEPDVDVTPAPRRVALRVESCDARRRRHAVQRHVDDRRHASSGRGAGCRVEAFPLRASWFVDVDVRIDDARGYRESADIEVGTNVMRLDRGDPAVLDRDRRRTDAVGKDDACAADDQLRAARLMNDPAPARPTNFPFSITTRPRDSTVSVAPVTCRPSYGL